LRRCRCIQKKLRTIRGARQKAQILDLTGITLAVNNDDFTRSDSNIRKENTARALQWIDDIEEKEAGEKLSLIAFLRKN